MGTTQVLLFQVLPIVLFGVVAFVAFSYAKKNKQRAQGSVAEFTRSLRSEFEAARKPNESDAAFVMMATRNLLKKNHGFYVALTDQRFFLLDPGQGNQLRVFEREMVSISAKKQRWTDIGNMQTTISEGWEITITLPQGESYSGLRMYASDGYYADQERGVPSFLAALSH
jgi:hypothetical protein